MISFIAGTVKKMRLNSHHVSRDLSRLCASKGDVSRIGLFAFPGPNQNRDGVTSRTTDLDVPQESHPAAARADARSWWGGESLKSGIAKAMGGSGKLFS